MLSSVHSLLRQATSQMQLRNPPRFTLSEDATSGELVMEAPTSYIENVHVFTTFGYSKGAYHNAATVPNPGIMQQCTTSASQTINDCLYFSGDCVSCPPDPNAYPGETSCWCKKPDPLWSTSVPFLEIAPGTKEYAEFGLETDTNADGVIDQQLYSDPNSNPTGDQVRARQIAREMGIVEWEDIPTGPNGDFNDMMFYVQGRECSTEASGFPHMSFSSGEGSSWDCVDECGNVPADCSGVDHLVQGDARFAVSVSIDSSTSELDLESRGRLIQVMVATFGEPGVAGSKMVVCPTLRFDRSAVSPDYTFVGYGINPPGFSPFCDETPPNNGMPICSSPLTQPPVWEDQLALSRDQLYDINQCNPTRVGPGDVFELQPRRVVQINNGTTDCDLAMPHLETYEVEVDKVASVLDPAISSMTSQDILQMINGVTLLFIHEPHVSDNFYCPSGFNLIVTTVERAIGTLQRTWISDGELNYTENIRD